ncbi:MAG: ferrous iron transport protein A [Deltaproteobacteria bacterium]|nr:ferrous iron transport protein A [Deltaproteobacteria bacterium]
MAKTLADTNDGARVTIAKVDLDDDVASWLAAVGLAHGEEVVVLRRAVLGGPLHVRTASGGEFAVAREVAVRIGVGT